jgi:hypothetical protein
MYNIRSNIQLIDFVVVNFIFRCTSVEVVFNASPNANQHMFAIFVSCACCPELPLVAFKHINLVISSLVDTFRVAIYAMARKLLSAIATILVWLRPQLRRRVALLYTDKGSVRDLRNSALEGGYT